MAGLTGRQFQLPRDVTTSVFGSAVDNSQSASGDAPTTTMSEEDTTAFENIATPPSPTTPTPPTNPIIHVTPRVEPQAPRRWERSILVSSTEHLKAEGE